MVCVVSLFAGELPIHGFGVKTQGPAAYGSQLASADSLASATGRAALRPRCPARPTSRTRTAWSTQPTGGASCWSRRGRRAACRVGRTPFVSATARKLGGPSVLYLPPTPLAELPEQVPGNLVGWSSLPVRDCITEELISRGLSRRTRQIIRVH